MTNINNSDLILAPDIDSFKRLPLYDSEFGNIAAFMCYVLNPDGTPASGCTRNVLKKALEEMKGLGFTKLNIGFEPEFSILKRKPADHKDTSVYLDSGTYADAEGENDFTAHIRREIMFELERAGIVPLVSHHERAPSAYEIPYRYNDAMRACDDLVLGKLITKAVARKHGLYATFEPKPFDGVNGNGLNTNVSLSRNEQNVFVKDGGISDIAKNFLTGVLLHAESLCFLTNPTEDSYRRLVEGFEAPINICWGYHNRSAMIRVPNASGESTRIEIRSPDCNMNPYLGVAGILLAGLDGVTTKAILPRPIDSDAGCHKNVPTLPRSIAEAKKAFLGSSLFSKFHFLQVGAVGET